jgi:hypothetical protein
MSAHLRRRVRALEKIVGVEQPDVESMPDFEGWVELFAKMGRWHDDPEHAREAVRGFFLDCVGRGEQPTWAALAKIAGERMQERLQPGQPI